jgi:hypothetical protein
MRVGRAGENAKLGQHFGRDAILREHALHRVGNNELRIPCPHLRDIPVALATDVTGEKHVLVLLFLLTRENNLLGIDDDDVIAGIDRGRVRCFVPTANHVGGFNGETAKGNTGGINQIPLGLHSLLFGEEGFHGKRGQELGFRGTLSTPVFTRSTDGLRMRAATMKTAIRGLVSPRGCVTVSG